MDDNLTDENGIVVDECNGIAVGYQIYYQENEQDIDCCTLGPIVTDRDYEDIKEFVDMWS